jgi:soluble lytic murein transglycosylase
MMYPRVAQRWQTTPGPHRQRFGATTATVLLASGLLVGSAFASQLAEISATRSAGTDRVVEAELEGLLDVTGADRVLRARSQRILGDPGASLRAAGDAIDAGDRSHARWLLDETLRRHPIIGDYASLMLARILLEDGHADLASAVTRQALLAYRNSLIGPELRVLLGEARNDAGDSDGAYAAWRAALDQSKDSELRSNVLLSIAAAQERQGLDEEAATTYKLIWYAYPTSEEARIATHRLELLEEYLRKSLRSGIDWRRRGDRLFRKRHNEDALDAYERALELGLTRSDSRRARKQRAHSLFRQRRYPEAVQAFGALPQKDDIPIWHARSLARAGEVPEAIYEFERLAEKRRGTIGVRARFLAALLLDGRGFDERAERHFRAVSQSGPSAGMGDAAAWRLGWAAYRKGAYEQAILHFDRLIARKQGDAIGQLRARYWRARAHERIGDPLSQSEYAAIGGEFPFSYYGWRAMHRVEATVEPAAPREAPKDRAGRLSPRELAKARILLEGGLTAEARREIRALSRKARSLGDRIELAELSSEAGDFHLAQRMIVDPYSETLARGPLPKLEELWWYAWPSAYSELVDEATQPAGSVEAELVWSIMREESGYRATIISPVGARGLLQIMTPTGEQLAERTGLADFEADDLFVPRINIGLGSHYLGELSRIFSGRLSPSIASYNAGPEAVSSWTLAKLADDDEWVESIPYDQTRSYVKRVLRSLHAYRVLY